MMESVPPVLQAGFWGLVAGSALVIGATIGYFVRLPAAFSSSVMAFGIGVLVSALSFDLMQEAFAEGGVTAAAVESVQNSGVMLLAGVELLTLTGL
ncbi:hypothetical protein ACG74X_19935 [Marivita sp. S0852]|uniref:hypothetical protein n=1 Tax=Marivita sp. S0852 TaxID=3373893 RepID=UPI003981D8C9